MQLFDYLANYLQITWLIDLQLMNKHGRRSTPVTTVFCWRQTNLFDLSDHSQETPSHATSRYRPGSKNLLIHKQKSPPSQTLEIFIRHTSQLLFLISSITKMLVFWASKKKNFLVSHHSQLLTLRVSGEPDRVFLNCTEHTKKILHGSFDPEL